MKDQAQYRRQVLLPAAMAVALSITYAACGTGESPESREGEHVAATSQAATSAQACTIIQRPGLPGTGIVYDTQIKNGPASALTQTFGASQTMNTGPLTGAIRQSLIRFDLSSIPSGPNTSVQNAYVSLTEGNIPPTASSTINVHRVTTSWTEAGASWETFQEDYDPAILTSFSNYKNGSQNKFPIFTVTQLVESWIQGIEPNYGFLLDDPSGNSTNFWTSEYGTVSNRPELYVCFKVTCNPGFADCNNNGLDGCETELATSTANCGACGSACPGGQVCQNSACVPVCPGSFGAAATYPIGSNAHDVAVWDLNGDGLPDLVTADEATNQVSVVLNQGGGVFGAPVNIDTGAFLTTYAVAVGDLNGDGMPDIVAGTTNGQTVEVLTNLGGGAFAVTASYNAFNKLTSVAVADVNGDHHPDIVFSNWSGAGVMLNNGDGTFATAVVRGGITGLGESIAVADMNGDGMPDLVLACSSGKVAVFLNQGGGVFGTPTSLSAGTAAYSVAVGDLNGDGMPDIAVTNFTGNNFFAPSNVTVLLNKGGGTFAAPAFYPSGGASPGQDPHSVAIADVNNDGRPDLIVANEFGPTVLLNQGSGIFGPPTAIGGFLTTVVAADLNGDGLPDLAGANDINGASVVTVLLNQSACANQTPTCTDGVKNGAETATDCGGGTCPPCAANQACVVASDCSGGVCTSNACEAPTCTDGVKNGTETAVDCGGSCPGCATGMACVLGTDCVTGVCSGGLCQAPSCTDGIKNGAETAVDCGGGTCPPCPTADFCLVASDCVSDVCSGAACQAPTCTDGVKNGAETAVDCGGGSCPGCAAGQGCAVASDCSSGVCTGSICQAPTCVDGVKNGAETAVDCGGGTCSGCAVGKTCVVNTDCARGLCQSGVCAPPLQTCASASWTSAASIGIVQPSPALGFAPSSSFSFAVWASLSAAPGIGQHLVVKGDNSSNEWSLTYFNNTLCFNRQGLYNIACAAAPAGAWHHYAATYAAGAAVLYVDGAQIATGNALVGSPANTVLNVGNFMAGGQDAIGQMDDLAIWSKALTAAQVLALYNKTSTPSGVGSVVAEWPLDDDTGTSAQDASGNGHTMTLDSVGWSATCYDEPPEQSLFTYTTVSGITHRNNGPYTVGTLFKVGSSNITITALGVQDDGAGGPNTDGFLAGSLPAGLWDATGTTMLASATVLSTDPLTGTYRFHTLASPVTLLANTEYLIGAVVGSGFEWFEDSFDITPAAFSGQGGITMIAPQFHAGSTLAAPLTVSPDQAGRYAAASALFY